MKKVILSVLLICVLIAEGFLINELVKGFTLSNIVEMNQSVQALPNYLPRDADRFEVDSKYIKYRLKDSDNLMVSVAEIKFPPSSYFSFYSVKSYELTGPKGNDLRITFEKSQPGLILLTMLGTICAALLLLIAFVLAHSIIKRE